MFNEVNLKIFKLSSSDKLCVMNDSELSNEFSRSYSSGIDNSSASNNRLRVHSRNSESIHCLKVRSNPSSPNRASKSQHLSRMHRKWSQLRALNVSSGSECENQPSVQQSNNNTLETVQYDQLDIPNIQRSPLSAPLSTTNSYQSLHNKSVGDTNLGCEHLFRSTRNLHYGHRSSNCSSTNLLVKQSAVEDETNERDPNIFNITPQCADSMLLSSSQRIQSSTTMGSTFKTTSPVCSIGPVNFKKVLRDRYLNSQRSSNATTFSSTTSSSFNPNLSVHDDSSLANADRSFSESEDHNFPILKQKTADSSSVQMNDPSERAVIQSDQNHRVKASLSLDLLNLTAPNKYRIKSTNSTISSMSGVEIEGDPFSPATTEICSPFLKLNLPYRMQGSQSGTPHMINTPSMVSSGNTTSTSTNLDKVQKFFPENVSISEFPLSSLVNQGTSLLISSASTLDQQQPKQYQYALVPPPTHGRRVGGTSSLTTSPVRASTLKPGNGEEGADGEGDSNSGRSGQKLVTSRSMDQIQHLHTVSSSIFTEGSCTQEIKNKKSSISANIAVPGGTTGSSGNSTSSLPIRQQQQQQQQQQQLQQTSRKCRVCDRVFSRSDMLARHYRVHTGHRPFECSVCGQSFSRSDHLNTHLRIHSGEKPYRCSICSYSACRRDMITRHLRVHKRKGDISSDCSPGTLVVITNKSTRRQRHRNTNSSEQRQKKDCHLHHSSASSLFPTTSPDKDLFVSGNYSAQGVIQPEYTNTSGAIGSNCGGALNRSRSLGSYTVLSSNSNHYREVRVDANNSYYSSNEEMLVLQQPPHSHHCYRQEFGVLSRTDASEHRLGGSGCDGGANISNNVNNSNLITALTTNEDEDEDDGVDDIIEAPKTFGNISISICQPTPRSSFSIPSETNYK